MEKEKNYISAVARHYLRYLVESKGRSHRSVRSHESSLHMLCCHLSASGIMKIESVNRRAIHSFIDALSKAQYTPLVRASIIGQLKRFFRFAVQEGYLKRSPFRQKKASKLKGELLCHYLTIEEIEKFFNKAEEYTNRGLMYRALFELLYGSGVRVGEAIELQVGDVDLELGCLTVRATKKNIKRILPLPELTIRFLDIYLHEVRPAFVGQKGFLRQNSCFFLRPNGASLSEGRVTRMLKQIAKHAHIDKNVGSHSFRHSYAAHMYEAGIGVARLAKLLGYSSFEDSDAKQLADRLEKEASVK